MIIDFSTGQPPMNAQPKERKIIPLQVYKKKSKERLKTPTFHAKVNEVAELLRDQVPPSTRQRHFKQATGSMPSYINRIAHFLRSSLPPQ